jgi:hypothetical protein
MAIDFVRGSSSKIVQSSGTVPAGVRPIMMECWFKCDGWLTTGVSYGYLMGVFSTTFSLEMALRIKRDTTSSPPFRLEFVVTNFGGTFISYINLNPLPTVWSHAIGYWNSQTAGYLYVYHDGVIGTGSATNSLFLGANTYDFGWDPVSAGNHFDGQIAEWATWAHSPTSGTGQNLVKTACKGWNPDDRDPFYWIGTQRLRSWVPGHNTSINDVMRPSVTWTETNVSTVEDHPPVFAANKNVTHPGAVTAPAPPTERIIHIGGLVGKDSRVLLAG